MQKFGKGAFKERRYLYKLSQVGADVETTVYKTVMANVIYSSIPEAQISSLSSFSEDQILNHLGNIIEEILPYDEFDQLSKDTQQFHLIFIRGYIHGGISYSQGLIKEAKDEEEVEEVPKKTEDILGEMDYGDITEQIQEKIRKEIDKDNKKIEEEEEQEEEMVEELEPEELDDDMGFDTEETEDSDFDSDSSFDDGGDFDSGDTDLDDDLESSDEEMDSDGLDDSDGNVEDVDPAEDEELEEDIFDDEDAFEDDDLLGESTFEKIASSDPFGNNIDQNDNCIRLIKQKVVETYAGNDNDNVDQAKLDTILYVSTAIAFHELGIMKKAEFLKRVEEM